MSQDETTQPLKRPTIFFIILDFLIALILSIILLEVQYSSDIDIAKKQKQGRISITIILIIRVIYSSVAEWVRQNFFKPKLIDVRQSFKLYAITRYLFIIISFPTVIFVSVYLLEFKGTLFSIVIGVLIAQEILIILMIIHKVVTSKKPASISYIEKEEKAENSAKKKTENQSKKQLNDVKIVDLSIIDDKANQNSSYNLSPSTKLSNNLNLSQLRTTFEQTPNLNPDSFRRQYQNQPLSTEQSTFQLLDGGSQVNELKRLVFLNAKDKLTLKSPQKERGNSSNELFSDPFDQYIAQGRERSNTSLKKDRRVIRELTRKVSMSYSTNSQEIVNTRHMDQLQLHLDNAYFKEIQECCQIKEQECESNESISGIQSQNQDIEKDNSKNFITLKAKK